MAKYKIEIKKSALKELKKLPKEPLKRILKKIQSLETNPRPKDAVKLSNQERYRIRVDTYRILYSIEDAILIVTVVKVAHRRDVYKKRS